MAARSHQLAAAESPAGGATMTLYTVPALTRTIVKDFRAFNGGSGSAKVDLYWAASLGSAGAWFFGNQSLPFQGILGGACWFVLNAGDRLVAFTNIQHVRFMASGAELPL